MKISVIHPSRGRPQQCYETVKRWVTSSNIELEYIVSIDFDDAATEKYLKIQQENLAWLLPNHNKSAIQAINNAAMIATGDLLIVCSDDFDCPEHWDTLLLQQLQGKSDFLVKTQDGIQPTLITLPILDRTYYERFGYIYHPDYLHMFSDQEMTAVGHMLGRVIKSDLLFPHNHYSTKRTPKDAINIKNDATWDQGKHLFNERLKTNFGIDKPVIRYSQIRWR